MTYSQRGSSQAGASSNIAHLEYRIGELSDRTRRLADEIEASQSGPEERLKELRAELEQARNELGGLQEELAAYED
ncbi:hypothetical protein [Saccharibacillus alkalitolerans]|uniref:Uncharacterized protein n=1 Tax=Saccharibacillus alkalitolerans TaxID=2705290 RepID=A0ABX0FAD9_9BACL|nr:hypothetical protein [Saccharibacillus alkalitolerans]NGZ77365.1 hypothetical protein [Saccharibacillus alkalitolerans]